MAWFIHVPDCASPEEKLHAEQMNKIYKAIEYGENYVKKYIPNIWVSFFHDFKEGVNYNAYIQSYDLRNTRGDFNCKYNYKHEVYINFPNNMERSLLNIQETMRHEIAHAIAQEQGFVGHDWNWIKIAKLLRVRTARYEPPFSSLGPVGLIQFKK